LSRGKYLSLEEARKLGKLDKFAEEHPSEGDSALFDLLIERAAGVRSSSAASGTSTRDASAGSSGTRTRRGS
jgi:hypothetical protein